MFFTRGIEKVDEICTRLKNQNEPKFNYVNMYYKFGYSNEFKKKINGFLILQLKTFSRITLIFLGKILFLQKKQKQNM